MRPLREQLQGPDGCHMVKLWLHATSKRSCVTIALVPSLHLLCDNIVQFTGSLAVPIASPVVAKSNIDP